MPRGKARKITDALVRTYGAARRKAGTVDGAAAALGIPPSTVRVWHHLARKRPGSQYERLWNEELAIQMEEVEAQDEWLDAKADSIEAEGREPGQEELPDSEAEQPAEGPRAPRNEEELPYELLLKRVREGRSEGEPTGREKELGEVCGSFAHFLSTYVHIRDGGGEKLTPWPFQTELAGTLTRHRRLVILKARQLGISWIAAAYGVWTALTQPGAVVLLLSQTESDARELLDKAKFVFEHLPLWMMPRVGRENVRTLEFPVLHSVVEVIPSTPKAGRGKTARLVIADEHAFHPWPEAQLAAIEPTMEAGGQLISISTAGGLGNLFADLVARARDGNSEWQFLFFPYHCHPGRDAAWYERRKETYTRAWMICQEYPRDADEAFVQTGRPVFDLEYLQKHLALTHPALCLTEPAPRMTNDASRVTDLASRLTPLASPPSPPSPAPAPPTSCASSRLRSSGGDMWRGRTWRKGWSTGTTPS
jgi:hypothetical protein